MVKLKDTRYSRDATVAAVHSYYQFLSRLYVPSERIVTPPDGGWPDINQSTYGSYRKNDTVIDLLRHLPYIADGGGAEEIQGAGSCHFADYREPGMINSFRKGNDVSDNVSFEGEWYEKVPAHVVGLTNVGRYGSIFLLDTQHGIVYWMDSSDDMKKASPCEAVEDKLEGWIEDEPAVAWPVENFFEMLKYQFQQLNYMPVKENKVLDRLGVNYGDAEPVLDKLKGVYQEHGWPESEKYDKIACLKAVQQFLKDNYKDADLLLV